MPGSILTWGSGLPGQGFVWGLPLAVAAVAAGIVAVRGCGSPLGRRTRSGAGGAMALMVVLWTASGPDRLGWRGTMTSAAGADPTPPRTLEPVSIPSLADLHARGAAQQPTYADRDAVDAAVGRLRTMPPLVFAGECDDLKAKLAHVARGKAFLLQGGDCAETFTGVTADNVRNKLRVLLQMAVVLTYAASVPVVKVGRIAGQYAKPRSSDLETRDGRDPAGVPRRRRQRLRVHPRVAGRTTRSGSWRSTTPRPRR